MAVQLAAYLSVPSPSPENRRSWHRSEQIARFMARFVGGCPGF
jgi:hypothetical protein